MQVEDDLGDLDDTQVAGPGRRRWKEDNVAKDMLTSCPEDAAITSRLLQDTADRDRRLAEGDEAMLEKVTGLVNGVSASMDSRMTNLEHMVQDQWKTFEKHGRGKHSAARRQRGCDHPSGAPY